MKRTDTWHIHIQGQVQGVGFRPFIYQLAQKFGLSGWVKNSRDGVHIEFNAKEDISKNFYHEVLLNAPQLANINQHCMKKSSSVVYEGFEIMASSNTGSPVLLISPDFAMCENCSKEIADKANRRYQYAFTTCTQCGPRYSIMRKLPYDRENTTMHVFKMCSACNDEYKDPMNRRYFSQTNSCPACPVIMKLYDKQKNCIEEDQEDVINKICAFWNQGKIVAVKGIGGYLLTCDAANHNAVEELRKRKHRPAKPFALMFPDIISLGEEVQLNPAEIMELRNPASAIVLLDLKANAKTKLVLNDIAPGLLKIGAMLPYTPLYQLLLQKFSKPIVATSANISNASIIFKNDVAINELNSIADYILVHNREIIASQDDSVVTCSPNSRQRIMIRSARGFAPLYNNKSLSFPKTTILAMGALLKSSFTLLKDNNIHLSQFLGDTDNYDAQNNYDRTLHHLLAVFHAEPEVILADKHPDYFTAKLGEQLAKKWGSKLLHIQHHEAHFASVLGEHNLFEASGPILGVVWDGTGFGDDGHIWGGEFFTYEHHIFSRLAHFDYYTHFLGDKMAREPRLSALSVCNDIEEAVSILKPKFTDSEWKLYLKLIGSVKLKTSSAGRLFDAAASLLELSDLTSFEGEAAMLLEKRAGLYFRNGLDIPSEWLKNDPKESVLSVRALFKNLALKIRDGINKSEIAAWFHVQLVVAIERTASDHHCRKICCSGGVFQNGLLVDLIIKVLANKHELYFNKDLSPNDENVSFGQLMVYSSKMGDEFKQNDNQ